MAMSLASVDRARGRPGVGKLRQVASESALFALSKAAACEDVQVRFLGFPVRAA